VILWTDLLTVLKAKQQRLGVQWSPEMQNSLASVYLNRGSAYLKQTQFAEAISDYEQAIKFREDLRQHLGQQWALPLRFDLAKAYIALSLVYQQQDNRAAVAEVLAKIADFIEIAALPEPLPEYIANLQQWAG